MPKKYLVGNSENTWPLELAYQRAEDGDIIVLELGFSYSPANTNQNFNDVLFIDKNLEFIGNITEEDSVINFSNIIASKIVIKNGVRVKFSNIYFKLDRADHNFYVSEHSKLELSCVVIENTSESNEHYAFSIEEEASLYANRIWVNVASNQPILFTQSSAEIKNAKLNVGILALSNTRLKLENITLKASQANAINLQESDLTLKDCEIHGEGVSTLYAENSNLMLENNTIEALDANVINLKASSLTARNCTLLGEIFPVIYSEDSKSEFENAQIKALGANAINLKDSTTTFKNSTLSGGDNEKKFPAIYMEHSNLYGYDAIFEQKQYSSCLYVLDNSYLFLEDSSLTSLDMHQSRGVINGSIIRENLSLNEYSYLTNKDKLEFFGESLEKVELYLGENSALIANEIVFSKESNQMIRLNEFSHLKAEKLIAKALQLEVSEDSCFINREALLSTRQEDGVSKTAHQERILSTGSEAREKLNNLVGLAQVKKEINKMIGMVDFNNLRIKQGLAPENIALHSVFMGNPGTGKTMVARLIGEILYHSKVLSGEDFIFVEASEPDLISSYVGGTAERTQALLDKAKGGILFIDEAYTLNKKGSNINYGQEAINTMLKYMEDHREDIMIIFAGYTKEMEEFLRTNPGLASRVPNKFIFEDYTPEEIVAMGIKFLSSRQYTLEDEEYYKRSVKNAYASALDKSNGRWIRNFNEKLIASLAHRVYQEKSTDVTKIQRSDIDEVLNIGKYEPSANNDRDYLADLENMIGILSVKEKVKEFIALAELNKKRVEQGQAVSEFTLHSKFLGNPGTGKTTVARIIGNILYQKGIIAQNKFIEVSRSDLVAGYVGQTAIKTREVLQSALGGVLFIDEAYSLNSSASSHDFGMECIDEILKFIEDHRQDMVIIFAGYTKEMDDFLNMNSGLNSRVPNTFLFKDYSGDEIVAIGLMGLKKYGYLVDEEHYAKIVKYNYSLSDDHSNGRWIRNFNEDLIRQMSSRIAKDKSEDFNTITSEDLGKML